MEPGRMLDRIQEVYGKLNLSEEQKGKVKTIIDGAKKDVAAAVKDLEGKEPRRAHGKDARGDAAHPREADGRAGRDPA